MLKTLSIQNLALIKNLQINFSKGMTCLTGETGAGKSIMLDAINLVLGGKCSSSLFNSNNDTIIINAQFEIALNSQADRWITKNHLTSQENDSEKGPVLIELNRHITKNHAIKNKAFINKYPVSLQSLKSLGQYLIYIHGQHEHLSLLKESHQLKVLDSFGKLNQLSTQVHELYTQWAAKKKQLSDLSKLQADYQAKKQLLEFKINELTQANLKPNEWQELNEQYQWLANQQQYINQLNQASFILDEGDESQASVNKLLNTIIQSLGSIKSTNESLKNINDFINQALIQTEEASNELKIFLSNQETDENLLNKLDQRLSELHDLSRKYKTEPGLLHEHLIQCEQEIAKLNGVEAQIEHLNIDIKTTEQEYLAKAQQLSEKRQVTSQKLSSELTRLLKKLRMQDAEMSIFLQPLAENKFSPTGLETVIFLVKTNSGDNFKPLNQGVSGGELSRVALSSQVVTAQVEGTPSLIFDEVDVGIGGGTAEIVGQLLRRMGKSTQVMCITHLAQVAAQAAHHIRVSKNSYNGITNTKIEVLDKQQRVTELSRMIGGLTITKQTTAHAEELLEQAEVV